MIQNNLGVANYKIEERGESKTILHSAVNNSALEGIGAYGIGISHVIKILIEHGANVNALNSQYKTPLNSALTAGRPDIAEYLIEPIVI